MYKFSFVTCFLLYCESVLFHGLLYLGEGIVCLFVEKIFDITGEFTKDLILYAGLSVDDLVGSGTKPVQKIKLFNGADEASGELDGIDVFVLTQL